MKLYVEAGALDGIFQSCTHDLEQTREWIGILIEPNPESFNDLTKNRSSETNTFINCALVSFDHSENFIDFYQHRDHGAMNGVIKREDTEYKEVIQVPCKTLQSIFDEHCITFVDKMFLDVEGYELEVLKGIDFSKTTINELEVEVHAKSVQKFKDDSYERESVINFLLKNNYVQIDSPERADANAKLLFKPA
jgi:FkbM family methyltransferase